MISEMPEVPDLRDSEVKKAQEDFNCRNENIEKSKNFKCNSCPKTFDQVSTLYAHIKANHKGQKFKCKLCQIASFSFTNNLRSHFKTYHNGQGVFQCQLCDKSFLKKTTIQSHMQKQHKDVQFVKSFEEGPNKFYEEINVQVNLKKFKCSSCEKSFNHQKDLKSHVITDHNGSGTLKCKYCEKIFVSDDKLKNHIKIKHEKFRNETHLKNDDLSLKCKMCEKSFIKFYSLKDHLRDIHNSTGLHNCKMCKNTFLHESTLTKHIAKKHKDNKEPLLNKYFKRKPKSLTKKSDIFNPHHQEKQIFPCNKCARKFEKETNLQNHITVHHDGKRMKCTLCGALLTKLYSLKRHFKSNHKEKGIIHEEFFEEVTINVNSIQALKCKFCEETTNSERMEVNHLKEKHGLMKNLKCNLCEKVFGYIGNLRQHFNTSHGGHGIFKCDLCEKAFLKRNLLFNHIQTIHDRSNNNFIDDLADKPNQFYKESTVKFATRKYQKLNNKQIRSLTKHKNETSPKSDDQTLKCKICDKTFKYMVMFKTHLRTIHNGADLYECNQCSKAFFRDTTLEKHIKKNHNGSDKMLKDSGVACNVSDIKLPDVQILKNHYETHSSEIQDNEDQNPEFAKQTISETDTKKQGEEEQVIQCDTTTPIMKNPNLMCNVCLDYFQDKNSLLNHTANDHLAETLNYVMTVVLKSQ